MKSKKKSRHAGKRFFYPESSDFNVIPQNVKDHLQPVLADTWQTG